MTEWNARREQISRIENRKPKKGDNFDLAEVKLQPLASTTSAKYKSVNPVIDVDLLHVRKDGRRRAFAVNCNFTRTAYKLSV